MMPRRVDDTDPEAHAALIEAVRRAPVAKRLALASALVETTRALALADLRSAFPTADDAELRRRLARRILTGDEIRAAYGWDPEALDR